MCVYSVVFSHIQLPQLVLPEIYSRTPPNEHYCSYVCHHPLHNLALFLDNGQHKLSVFNLMFEIVVCTFCEV